MPVLRGGARRGRRPKQQQQQPQPQPQPNTNNNDQSPIEGEAIAARTRRRRAAAAAAAATLPVDENVGRIPPAAAAAAAAEGRAVEKEVKEEAIRAKRREEVGDKPMDDYDSGAKSPERGHAADDDGSAAPLPEKVSLFTFFRVLQFICVCFHLHVYTFFVSIMECFIFL